VITLQLEEFARTYEEMKPLFEAHWREVALDRERIALDPDYGIYLAREAMGEVLLVTARERGQVVAYFIGFVAPALHYRTCLTLTQDIFWVAPAYRSREGSDSLEDLESHVLARSLFERVLAQARFRGVKRVYLGFKASLDASVLFEELGLVRTDIYYSRLLGD